MVRKVFTVSHKICQVREVDDLQRINAANVADNGKDRCNRIACENTHDEGNQTDHLFAEGCAKHGNGKGNQTANDRNLAVTARRRLLQIADRIAGKRETDDRNRRTDNDSGHQLIDPLYACKFYDDGDHNVYETCEDRAEDQSEIAEAHGHTACKSRSHRAEERKRRSEEYRAVCLGKEDVHERTYARTEERRSGLHAVADDDRHNESCRHDRKQLLDRKYDQLTELRLVFNVVDQFQNSLPPKKIYPPRQTPQKIRKYGKI